MTLIQAGHEHVNGVRGGEAEVDVLRDVLLGPRQRGHEPRGADHAALEMPLQLTMDPKSKNGDRREVERTKSFAYFALCDLLCVHHSNLFSLSPP